MNSSVKPRMGRGELPKRIATVEKIGTIRAGKGKKTTGLRTGRTRGRGLHQRGGEDYSMALPTKGGVEIQTVDKKGSVGRGLGVPARSLMN